MPFSALTVWYLPGLDHEAHLKGMPVYKDYLKNRTDNYISLIVSRLKELDEFDNKIFIIVADHGHTAMPTNLTYPKLIPQTDIEGNYVGDSVTNIPAEMSCKLKVDGFEDKEKRKPELANNNLHVWELAEMIVSMKKVKPSWDYTVLAPLEIAVASKGATADINKANMIATLNGPLAHIYLKNGTSWSDKNVSVVDKGRVASFFRTYLAKGGVGVPKEDWPTFKNLLSSIDMVLVRGATGYEIFNGVTTDDQANVTGLMPTTPLASAGLDPAKYVKIKERLDGLNDPDRSGDILLLFKDDTYAADAKSRFTSGVACKSWHASLNPSDSYVPFIVSYPGGHKDIFSSQLNMACGSGCKYNYDLKNVVLELLKNQF